MKILWVSHLCPFPPKGGVSQRSFNLLKELSKYNEISFVGFNQRSHLGSPEKIETAKKEFQKICKFVKVLSIPCENKKWGKFVLAVKCLFLAESYTVDWLKSKEMAALLYTLNQENSFDIVYFDTISLVEYADIFIVKKRILNHHNIESDMMLRRTKKESNVIKRFYFFVEYLKIKRYEARQCPKFDYNIVCSDLDAKRLTDFIPNLKVEIIPNGVDLAYFSIRGLPQSSNSVIFVGSMSWYPNRQAMLFFAKDIWPLLIAQIPQITVSIIGKAPPEELVKLSKSDQRLTVPGFVEDIRENLETASVYICPIMDGGGTKLKILDALAMGKAIVAHPIACEGINVKDRETVMFAESPSEFVECIKQLFSNALLRKSLGNNGRHLIEQEYSFKNIGQKLNLLCETIVKT